MRLGPRATCDAHIVRCDVPQQERRPVAIERLAKGRCELWALANRLRQNEVVEGGGHGAIIRPAFRRSGGRGKVWLDDDGI